MLLLSPFSILFQQVPFSFYSLFLRSITVPRLLPHVLCAPLSPFLVVCSGPPKFFYLFFQYFGTFNGLSLSWGSISGFSFAPNLSCALPSQPALPSARVRESLRKLQARNWCLYFLIVGNLRFV